MASIQGNEKITYVLMGIALSIFEVQEIVSRQ